ncbi:MAG: isoleucine--tRNA ligase [Elusimicrobiota bacterium]|jgi:isoleucyl-tRNA synthetase|nr:isoleucine--tRNA ligase [Elusimicrobiota bacterium]
MSKESKKESNKYSATVLLPKTDFPMRAGLPQKEPKLLRFWRDIKLYDKMLKNAHGRPIFTLVDGPPYANGRIHIGHALNKTLKDIVVKSRFMTGYNSPYIPGWDCHGLPIEQALIKEMKTDKREIKDIPAFRQKAREFALNFVNQQKEGFMRLGNIGDWDNPYLTMSAIYEGLTIESFFDACEKGYVYKGKKAVYWCPSCETALADAETEYHDKTSSSIFLRFRITTPERPVFEGLDISKPVYLAVWTTTPWTIPANMAAAVNADEDYRAMLMPDGSYLIAADKLADAFLKEVNLTGVNAKIMRGAELVGAKYEHPLLDKINPVISTDFVAMDTGVGIVHIAPGHGEDDFYAGLKWNLEIFCPVDEKGRFTKEAGVCEGVSIFKANPVIIDMLDKKGALIKRAEIVHSYPHCWRCKQPVIFRATEQWFLNIDKDGLRQRLEREIDKTEFYPAGGKTRLKSMVAQRPDWCLSRQRFWGVPIMVFYCKGCGKFQYDKNLFKLVVERTKKETSDFWFKETAEQILPAGYTCACGGKRFAKETDIMDVWFDSGVSWKESLVHRGLPFPGDIYLEGSDQHRGWFQTSLIAATVVAGGAPFRNIITHGMILDQQGKAMHKSAGNSVEPDEIFNTTGADILRLWAAMADYGDDVRLSKEILDGPVDAYRKIRNTVRYALGNLFDYEPLKHKTRGEDLSELDKYMLSRLDALIKTVREDYKEFRFRRAVKAVMDFCILDLSSLLLDASKDRLYTLGANAPARRSAQTALYEILTAVLKLLAPVLSFTCEEAWQELKKLPCGQGLEESIFLSVFPQDVYYNAPAEVVQKWDKIREVRAHVLKALEEARQAGTIGAPLEAAVVFNSSDRRTKEFLKATLPLWPEAAIISRAEVSAEDGKEPLEIKVSHAPGSKCPRCWQWKEDIGSNKNYPDICARCASVLEMESPDAVH